ncbi:hypothetical protein AC578_3511 [Pseudocercospora eumusae]|uniref:Uncharacterized protein n=1 Tax=Pseudocercospora eumusae TaxID=321146 RepID=A0A139H9K6_9PEZI|nr:hypothetical protein AC578_3511 [Pseudocercospora eumusae]
MSELSCPHQPLMRMYREQAEVNPVDFEFLFHYSRYTYDTLVEESSNEKIRPLLAPPASLVHSFILDLHLALVVASQLKLQSFSATLGLLHLAHSRVSGPDMYPFECCGEAVAQYWSWQRKSSHGGIHLDLRGSVCYKRVMREASCLMLAG